MCAPHLAAPRPAPTHTTLSQAIWQEGSLTQLNAKNQPGIELRSLSSDSVLSKQ